MEFFRKLAFLMKKCIVWTHLNNHCHFVNSIFTPSTNSEQSPGTKGFQLTLVSEKTVKNDLGCLSGFRKYDFLTD